MIIMEEMNALIALDSNTQIQVAKDLTTPFPVQYKKSPESVHTPKVRQGYTRLFPNYYELNHANVVDPKNAKVKLKSKETFTRFCQPPGQPGAEIFSTKEVYFIPLDFKSGRQLYLGKYNPNEKSAPDCQSSNNIVPNTNKFANSCGECKYSKWEGGTPPKCGELPEILGLDMTGSTVKDPSTKEVVTREAFTISFKKSAIGAVNDLKRKLAEPVLFSDGSYAPLDMTQYIVKMTASVAIDKDGKEATYCIPEFEIVGYAPHDISEELLASLNKEMGGKTIREMYIGRTEPFEGPTQNEEMPTEPPKTTSPPPFPLNTKSETVEVELNSSNEEDNLIF